MRARGTAVTLKTYAHVNHALLADSAEFIRNTPAASPQATTVQVALLQGNLKPSSP